MEKMLGKDMIKKLTPVGTLDWYIKWISSVPELNISEALNEIVPFFLKSCLFTAPEKPTRPLVFL